VHLSDESSLVGDALYGLHRGSEIEIIDARPAGMRQSFNFADLSSVEKYQMPESQYEKLDDSVLAWKKRAKLGRFDPSVSQKTAEEMAEERRRADREVIERRQIDVGMRCRVGRDDARRGVVRFVGEIGGLGGARESGCIWIGVELDEPGGRNDGSVLVEIAAAAADEDENGDRDHEEEEGKGEERQAGGGKEEKMVRLFECRDRFGVFVRPEKVEVGEQWSMLGLDDLEDEDMEEV
jgi:tubulin-folding cofactor B